MPPLQNAVAITRRPASQGKAFCRSCSQSLGHFPACEELTKYLSPNRELGKGWGVPPPQCWPRSDSLQHCPPTHPYLPSHQVQGHLSPGRTFPKSSPWQQDRGVMTRQRPGTERLTRGAGVRGEQGGIYSMSRQTWAQTSSFSLVCNLRKFPNHSELPFLPWWKPRYSFLAHRAVTRR